MEHLCLLLGFRFRDSECDLSAKIEDTMLVVMKSAQLCQFKLLAIVFLVLFLVSPFGGAAELVDYSYFISDPDLYNDYFPDDLGEGDVVILAFYPHSAPRSFVLDESGEVVHVSYRDADLRDGAKSFADREMNSKSVLPWNLPAYKRIKITLERCVIGVDSVKKEKIVLDGSVIQFYLCRGNGGPVQGLQLRTGTKAGHALGACLAILEEIVQRERLKKDEVSARLDKAVAKFEDLVGDGSEKK